MPQFNSPGDMLPNHGIPAKLVDYKPGFLEIEESRQLLEKLINETPWQEKSESIHGKEIFLPRLVAWFGEVRQEDSLSGEYLHPLPWTPELLLIKMRVEKLSGEKFDSVLLIYYRTGNDTAGWHIDNNGMPGESRVACAVCIGQPRMFDIRKRDDHSLEFSILLENGSYLLMKASFQEGWQYRIPKMKGIQQPLINLVFLASCVNILPAIEKD